MEKIWVHRGFVLTTLLVLIAIGATTFAVIGPRIEVVAAITIEVFVAITVISAKFNSFL